MQASPGCLQTLYEVVGGFWGGPVVKNLPAHAGDTRDAGWSPELGRSSGEGHGNPLQCSFLENSMDRGVWGATVHRVTKSQTQQKWLSMHIRLIWCDEKGTSPCSVCLQNSYFQINNEKISEIAKLRDILQNVWPVFFKNVEVMKDSWEIVTDGTRLRRHDN